MMCISLICLLLATALIIYWLCSYSRYFFVKAIFICLLFLACKCISYRNGCFCSTVLPLQVVVLGKQMWWGRTSDWKSHHARNIKQIRLDLVQSMQETSHLNSRMLICVVFFVTLCTVILSLVGVILYGINVTDGTSTSYSGSDFDYDWCFYLGACNFGMCLSFQLEA